MHPDPGFAKEVRDEDLTRYFEPSKWSEGVQVGVVENTLLPTRYFFENFTDSVRLWLNETSTTKTD